MTDIYLDNAAATLPAAVAVRVMSGAQKEFGNPSSFNDAGRRSAALLFDARSRVAHFVNARPDEIVFCASGSEANALALIGAARARGGKGIVCAANTEHLSVLEALRTLLKEGFRTETIPTNAVGASSVDDVVALLSKNTAVVSVMYANNEIGTIQPIARIGQAIIRWRRAHHSIYPLFHVDACQATTTLDMNVQRLGVDLLTFNGAKAYGPHGVAALYVRRGVVVQPLVAGGNQEGGRRAGTEDVAGAVGFAAALETIRGEDAVRMTALRDRLIEGILKGVPDARLNGPSGPYRLAGNVNISIPGCHSERLLLELDARGIRASAGSACTAHSVQPSHVLRAIGTPRQYLHGALRFSLSRSNTRAEIDAVVRRLPEVVVRVRAQKNRTQAGA